MHAIKTLFNQKFLLTAVLSVLCLGFVSESVGQTQMPLPNHNSVYTGFARGFWFEAPTSFTITGVRVPSQAGGGQQYIQVVRLNVTPPIAAGSQTSNFTTLLYVNGAANGVITPANITVNQGDIIGVLGCAGSTGTSNSYGTGAYTSSVYGSSFTMQRFGYQGSINSGQTNQVWGVGQGAGGSVGRVELYYGQPCSTVTNITTGGISSMAASFSWTGVTGSAGYDYVVDQSATLAPTGTPTKVTVTNGTATGLIPSTRYYVHVRNYCSSTSTSAWDTASFETLPPCSEPQGFSVTYVDSNNVSFVWNPLTTGVNYRYVVDINRSDPSPVAGTPTNSAIGNAASLLEGTKYYVHIKSYCLGDDSSGWSLDSFYTPIVCRSPEVSFANINSSRAVAYWQAVPSALGYEFLVSTEPATPVIGSKTINTSKHIPHLDANKKYYFHVRSHCSDRGILSSSQWRTFEFTTHALSVGNVSSEDVVMIYPNPASENVTFSVSNLKENGMLLVTDINGRVLQRVVIDKKEVNVSLAGMESGVYLLKYVNANGTGTYRLIKK